MIILTYINECARVSERVLEVGQTIVITEPILVTGFLDENNEILPLDELLRSFLTPYEILLIEKGLVSCSLLSNNLEGNRAFTVPSPLVLKPVNVSHQFYDYCNGQKPAKLDFRKLYHDGSRAYPEVGDTVYEDANGFKFFAVYTNQPTKIAFVMDNGRPIVTDESGKVFNHSCPQDG